MNISPDLPLVTFDDDDRTDASADWPGMEDSPDLFGLDDPLAGVRSDFAEDLDALEDVPTLGHAPIRPERLDRLSGLVWLVAGMLLATIGLGLLG